MEFRLLGPLEVVHEGSGIAINAGKLRALLAALLLDANTVVPVDRLIDAMWADRPPASAVASLHNHVMRLRRLLGDEGGTRIRAITPGYQIQVEPGELDSDTFAELCAGGHAAARAERWAKASADLAAALGLWRGAPLADVPTIQHGSHIQALFEARSQALEGRIAADLELGRHREVISELRALVAQDPLREGFHAQLMLALYRAARQAEALDVFRALRRTLMDELGVEPSPAVRQLHHRILNADPAIADPAPANRGPRFQLPADTRSFTGREAEIDRLIALAAKAPAGTDAGMVLISAIDGMGGIGKTALAIHAAHRIRAGFPDGQMFLDLRGFTAELEPMTAADALGWLLRALGVPPQLLPQDLGERAAYYRDRLKGSRTLIVLDNASSAAQIRPLLPGAPGCLVLVTSRKRLTGLDDAGFLALDVLSEADATALLHKVAGPGRLPGHHPAIRELLALCGHMPLAIRITAARLRHQPSLRLEDLVARLCDTTARLDVLKDEDYDLTAVFDLSYAALPGPEQQLFRLLGQIPGPDFDACTAANLAGTDHRTAEHLLDSLLDHNVLIQHTAGRYRFHDLIRVYAHGLGGADPAEDREDAIARLLDYYQHTAHAADRHLARHTRPRPGPAVRELCAPPLADQTAALAWMHAERDNLIAAIDYAAAQSLAARTVALTAPLASYFYQVGPWQQAAALHAAAADAADRCGDRLGQANALSDLGRVRHMFGDYVASAALPERALTVYRELGDRLGEANSLGELGRVRRVTGDFPASTGLLEQAVPIYRELGDRLGEANALWDLGRGLHMTGNGSAAISLLEQALLIYQELGHSFGEANALAYLGQVRQVAGDYPGAVAVLDRAQAIYHRLGSRLGEANSISDLGRIRLVTGDLAEAHGLHERALSIYRELGTRLNETNALADLARVQQALGDYPAADELYERALTMYRSMGSRLGEANTVSDLGRIRHAVGDHPAAGRFYERALAIYRDLGVRRGEAEVLASMGALAADTTGLSPALSLYREALDLSRNIGSEIDQAHALEGAAHCAEQLGDRDGALAGLREAIAIYRRIGAAELKKADAHLAELEGVRPLSG